MQLFIACNLLQLLLSIKAYLIWSLLFLVSSLYQNVTLPLAFYLEHLEPPLPMPHISIVNYHILIQFYLAIWWSDPNQNWYSSFQHWNTESSFLSFYKALLSSVWAWIRIGCFAHLGCYCGLTFYFSVSKWNLRQYLLVE